MGNKNVIVAVFVIAKMLTGCIIEKEPKEPSNSTKKMVELISPITTNITLKDLGLPVDYFFDGSMLEVKNNAILTIDEGVAVQFRKSDGCLVIMNGATIKALGSVGKRIKFIGASTNKGSWRGIEINSVTANELKYVDILNAGGEGKDWSAALYIDDGKADINYCLIDGSATNGLTVSSSSKSSQGELRTFTNNTVSNCGKAPVFTYEYISCYAVRNIDNTNTFSSNTNEYIHISGTYNDPALYYSNNFILGDMTLSSLGGYPWYFQHLMISPNRRFIIEQGTTILMYPSAVIFVAATSHLIAVGTPQARITFKCSEETGYWGGIIVDSKSPGTKFDYCDISSAGTMPYRSPQANGLILYESNSYLEIYNSHLSRSYGLSFSKSNGIVCEYSIPPGDKYFSPDYNGYLKHANVTFSDIAGSNFRINSPRYDNVNETGYDILPAILGNTWWQHF